MACRLDRRGFLVLGAGAVLAGCRSTPPPAPSATGGPTLSGTAPGPTLTGAAPSPPRTAQPPALPTARPWEPNPADVQPAAKLAAVRRIESTENTPATALEVIDAQYGGILADAASVLVVCRQWWAQPDQSVRGGGTTFDVRVRRVGTGWEVVGVNPSDPGPQGTPTAAAQALLGNPRVSLPPASRADVLSGRVHDSVVTALLTLSETYEIGVSVIRSGHPTNVFGTSRPSDHPLGRAFDTWRIDGLAVVDKATPRPLVEGFMRAAARAGSYNVGGPYALGSAPQFFSDDTHRDHVHAGFTT